MYDHKIIIIPKNKYIYNDFYLGDAYETKINASIGTSTLNDTFENELKKAVIAQLAGANIITDHSICGNISKFHQTLRNNIYVPISTVSIYELAINNEYFSDIEALEMIEE